MRVVLNDVSSSVIMSVDDMKPDDKVASVKNAIFDKLSMTSEDSDAHVFFNGAEAQDSSTLSVLGVADGSNLFFVIVKKSVEKEEETLWEERERPSPTYVLSPL